MSTGKTAGPFRPNPRIRTHLRPLAEAKDVSLYRLAQRTGRARSAITQIANGQRTPSLETVMEICDALGCQIGDLVEFLPPPEDAAEK